jgi:hypothetical protein
MTPEGALHRAMTWAARRRTHTRKCASQRATRIPVFQGSRALRELDPKAERRGGAGPEGTAVASDSRWETQGIGSGQTDIVSIRERGRDRSPHSDPKVSVPTWIRRVRGRTA